MRTVRAECLDWLLIVGRSHLDRVLQVYVQHYNHHRPDQALGLEPPHPSAGLSLVGEARRARVHRRDLLGGVLHEYQQSSMNVFTYPTGARKGEVIQADMNLAVVEKLRDADRGTTLFFCAGLRADGSWAATEFLVRHWQQLHREFGDDGFALCLGFPKTDAYLTDYREPIRLASLRT